MQRLISLYKESFSNIQKNIWILSVATFINRSGSMVLLFTSLYLTKELHFTISQAGIALSLYGVGSVLGSYVGGWLTDRKNFFYILIFSLIGSGLILLLLLFANTPLEISCVIFAYAFASDIFRPANSKAIAAYSSASNRTQSISLVRLAINLGFSVGPAIGGFVAVYLGYKFLFVIDACTSFAAAIMLYAYLPKITNEKKQDASSILNVKSTSAYRDLNYLIFIVLVAFYGICFFQLFASMPQYFDKNCNYSEDAIGLLLGLNGLLVVLIEMPLILILEKRKKIFRYIVIGALCLPVSFSFILYGNCLIVWVLLYTLVITFSEMFAMPFMMNYMLSRGGKERQGQYSGLYSIAFGISNIFAPLIGLGIADKYGFDAMLYFFAALGLITAIGFWMLGRREANH